MSTAGLCECGCGLPAPLSPTTWRQKGYVAGQPRRFVSGHNGRLFKQNATPLAERILARCVRVGECLIWPGTRVCGGYGMVTENKRRQYVHRVVYEHVHGAIPEGFQVDHVYARGCRSTACCEPLHLEAVTASENCLRRCKRVLLVNSDLPRFDDAYERVK